MAGNSAFHLTPAGCTSRLSRTVHFAMDGTTLRRSIGWRLLLASAVAIVCCAAAQAQSPDATEIMRRNYAVGKVTDSRIELTLTLINADGAERKRSTESMTKLEPNGIDEARLVRFTAPADIRGTSVLMIEHSGGDDDMWLYLPALHKVRRVVASNKKDSFVGTDFSYGDIMGHKVDEWQYTHHGTETVDGAEAHVIEGVPRTQQVGADSGYSKRKIWVRTDNFVAVKAQAWDNAGNLLKEFHSRDIREVDGSAHKWQAFDIEARDQQTGHATHLIFTKFEAGVGVKDDVFTTRTLEQEE
jgi:outer membrane lipoprotein-sorting protein